MFYILEIQKAFDDTCSHLVHQAADRNSAESTFHSVLSYAAVNTNLRSHSATIVDDHGNVILSNCYMHEQPVAEETNEEETDGGE